MKILALVGSPRRGGNTDLLVDALLEGAREAGVQAWKVYLADLQIAPCDGCRICRSTGECIHDDDMSPLYDRLFEADVWVVGTPVYWWGPSAQTKLFIDRWYRFAGDGRWRVRGKKAVLVSAFGDEKPDTPRHLVGMLSDAFAYLGMDFVGQVLVSASEAGEVAGNRAALDQARDMGRRVARS